MGKSVKFGIIGCGLMGKEFASAAGRWCHLNIDVPAPEIVGVCDVAPANLEWFKKKLPDLKYAFNDYKELLKVEEIDAIYCAVPHSLHEELYVDIIRCGKHLFGEKPFGVDQKANRNIIEEAQRHPEVFVRCTSEFPYYPAYQLLIKWIKEKKFGRIIEVKSGMRHSSDMDVNKPINWKRIAKINGEYGCMGDLGIHTQHVPFRAGWIPQNVCAKLSNIVTKRPDGKGNIVDCDTWDNATLLCDVKDEDGNVFPLTFETKRLAPGSTNTVYLEVYGMESSAYFTTDDPGAFHYTNSWGHEQAWSRLAVGNKPLFSTITGGIFEFGFSDSVLQMWAAFMLELAGKPVEFGCFTPDETRISHALQTAALLSHKNKTVEDLKF